MQWATRLGLPVLPVVDDPRLCRDSDLLLWLDDRGLALQQTGRKAPGPVRPAFDSGAMAHRRRGGQNELLGRAVGVGKKSPLQVFDATAGLARDAFVLADLGCEVVMCEQHPVIAAMLDSALAAAQRQIADWAAPAVNRLCLVARAAEAEPVAAGTDVIYLDPMFPARDKQAAVKKEMALFQALLEPQAEAGSARAGNAMMAWALTQDVARVVVKRPRKAPPLADCTPSHQISGKSVRFDVYVSRGLDGMRNSQRVKTD